MSSIETRSMKRARLKRREDAEREEMQRAFEARCREFEQLREVRQSEIVRRQREWNRLYDLVEDEFRQTWRGCIETRLVFKSRWLTRLWTSYFGFDAADEGQISREVNRRMQSDSARTHELESENWRQALE